MAFVLTLIYTALTLLSPTVLPDAIVAVHIAEVLGVLTILACIPKLAESGLGNTPETYLALGLIVATTISSIATGWLGGTPDVLLGFLPIIFNFFFISVSSRSLRSLRVMTWVMLAVAVYIILQGAIAENTGDLLNPYLERERLTDSYLYRHRGLGVLNDPNDFAQFLVLLVPLLWLRWKKKKYLRNLLFTVLPACVLLWGLYLTHSRGGIVALFAVILFGFKDKLGKIGSAIVTGLAVLGTVALNVAGGRGMNDDDGGRVVAWITGLEVFKSHPLVGVGVNNFGNFNPTGLTAHNSYILCMAELGLFGYFFWMGMIVFAWKGLSLMAAHEIPKEPEPDPATLPASWEVMAFPAAPEPPVKSTPEPATALFPEGDMQFGALDEAPAISREGPAEFAYAARILRISLVGLLTSSFFLSRTYSMTVYVLLGMAVALRNCSPFTIELKTSTVLKQTVAVMFASIIFLYLFVRIRGVS